MNPSKSPKNNRDGNEDESYSEELNRGKKYLDLLFKYRPRTEQEVKGRLQDKGYPDEVIDDLVRWARSSGRVDDGAFARYLIEDRMQHKPSGRSGLYKELLDHGVDPETANNALDEKLSERDEETECRRLAKKRLKRYRGDDTKAKYRKTSAFLTRRGFSRSNVNRVLKELLFDDD